MKTRIGFISNSSSSSFIVAMKPGKRMAKVSFEIDIEAFSDEKISTQKELDEYIIDEYGYKDDNTVEKILESEEFLRDTYEKAMNAIQSGYVVYFGSVSNESDSPESQFIYSNGFGVIETEDFVVIQDSEY